MTRSRTLTALRLGAAIAALERLRAGSLDVYALQDLLQIAPLPGHEAGR